MAGIGIFLNGRVENLLLVSLSVENLQFQDSIEISERHLV
jgi:hypothetical protein